MKVRLSLKKLHPKQAHIIQTAKRFNHLRCGRRFGKTTLIEELACGSVSGEKVGIWFPTYKDLSEVWKDLKYTYRNVITAKNETLHQITTIGKGLIDFWSMDDPEAGQGRKYHRAILDEAAKAPKLYYAWEHTIRPTLTDYAGDAFILSRPKGKNNGFHQLELKHRKFENWAFFHYTTYDNPHIPTSEIEEAKSQLDSLTFDQEYMAEYVDVNDKPFLYAFKEKIHVIDSYKINPHLPLIVSWDFNLEPMTAIIGQKPDVKSLVVFDEMNINDGSTPEICDLILARYPQFMFKMDVTGDATGQNRTSMIRGNVNHYKIIKERLQLTDRQLQVPKVNPSHINSRILCNSVLQNANVKITSNCAQTIHDAIYAAVDEEGELIKTQLEGLHKLDSLRYLLEIAFPGFLSKPHIYQ